VREEAVGGDEKRAWTINLRMYVECAYCYTIFSGFEEACHQVNFAQR